MDNYWPMAIVQNENDRRAHVQHTYDGAMSLAEARAVINEWRATQTVLCAWVVRNNESRPCWFQLFVDPLGNVQQMTSK